MTVKVKGVERETGRGNGGGELANKANNRFASCRKSRNKLIKYRREMAARRLGKTWLHVAKELDNHHAYSCCLSNVTTPTEPRLL